MKELKLRGNYLQHLIILIVFSISMQSAGKAQFFLMGEFSAGPGYVASDNLNNIYIVTDSRIDKYDEAGNLLFSYSSLGKGSIQSVDFSDPLKILLFYKDFCEVVFLDNKLAPSGDRISLKNLGYPDASLACSSFGGGFWIYDPLSVQLLRFESNLSLVQQSGDIGQLTGMEIYPSVLSEYSNYVYLYDSSFGILVFDRYGGFLKTLPFKTIGYFRVLNETLIYENGNYLCSYNLESWEERKALLPESKDPRSISIENNKLFFLSGNKLSIYSIE